MSSPTGSEVRLMIKKYVYQLIFNSQILTFKMTFNKFMKEAEE